MAESRQACLNAGMTPLSEEHAEGPLFDPEFYQVNLRRIPADSAPWRKCSPSERDEYFNYGFNEETFLAYSCWYRTRYALQPSVIGKKEVIMDNQVEKAKLVKEVASLEAVTESSDGREDRVNQFQLWSDEPNYYTSCHQIPVCAASGENEKSAAEFLLIEPYAAFLCPYGADCKMRDYCLFSHEELSEQEAKAFLAAREPPPVTSKGLAYELRRRNRTFADSTIGPTVEINSASVTVCADDPKLNASGVLPSEINTYTPTSSAERISETFDSKTVKDPSKESSIQVRRYVALSGSKKGGFRKLKK